MKTHDTEHPNLLFALLRHPLSVLVIGALLTSAIVPYIASKVNRAQLLQETRLRKEQDIFDQSLATDKQVNSMRTALESFYKDASSNSNIRKQQQEELRKQMNVLYGQFEAHSWYWCHAVEFESNFLELPSSAHGKIDQTCTSYLNNLSKTMDALNPVWGALVRESAQRNQFNSELVVSSHKTLDELAGERGRIVAELINLVAVE